LHEFGRQRRQALEFAFGPTEFDQDVLVLDKAGLRQPLTERRDAFDILFGGGNRSWALQAAAPEP
jgi:hypothetical protein